MRLKRASFLFVFLTLVLWDRAADGGVLKSLDQELSELVGKTDSYLVTVRGNDGWRNLVATGIIFDSHGYVVTSSQIYGAESFTVTFKNGRSIRASKAGVDQLTGLAVLRIAGVNPSLPRWGDAEKLEEGALVTVVGNSYEVPATLSFGGFVGTTEDGLLRLAVDVSPGGSGSAVLDVNGDLIGILVAKEAGQKTEQSDRSVTRTSGPSPYISRLMSELSSPNAICYAVPVAAVKNILGQIVSEGKVRRGLLGITSQNIGLDLKGRYGISGGVAVTGIDPQSPADLAGIQKGDIIVTIDNFTVADRGDLYAIIRNRRPDESIRIGLLRDKNRMTVEATLAQMQERPFVSGLELAQGTPTPVTARSDDARTAEMASEITRLKSELERLRSELKDLKKEVLK